MNPAFATVASARAGARPIRVLMVSDVYFPRVNGVSTSIETFRRSLAEFGVEVRLLVPRYGDEPDADGILRVAGRRVPGDPEDRLVSWRDMHRSARRLAAECDLVHIQTPFVAHYAGVSAARAHRRPLMLTYHTFFEEYLHHYAPWLPAAWLRAAARRFSRAQCNQVDAVVVPSTAMRDRLQAYGVTRPLQVLPTGIPLEGFGAGDGMRFRTLHGISPRAELALFVGRVAHEKNIAFLIDVARRLRPRLPELVLMIAGEGPAMPALRAQVAACGLDECVRFVGYLDRARALPDCYAAADAFVFASRTETQGLVLIEAMAASLPVVALAAMGTVDILAPRRGAVVPEDSVDAFAEALGGVLADPGLRARLARDAHAYSAEWSDIVMAGRLARLYAVVVEGACGASDGKPAVQIAQGL